MKLNLSEAPACGGGCPRGADASSWPGEGSSVISPPDSMRSAPGSAGTGSGGDGCRTCPLCTTSQPKNETAARTPSTAGTRRRNFAHRCRRTACVVRRRPSSTRSRRSSRRIAARCSAESSTTGACRMKSSSRRMRLSSSRSFARRLEDRRPALPHDTWPRIVRALPVLQPSPLSRRACFHVRMRVCTAPSGPLPSPLPSGWSR